MASRVEPTHQETLAERRAAERELMQEGFMIARGAAMEEGARLKPMNQQFALIARIPLIGGVLQGLLMRIFRGEQFAIHRRGGRPLGHSLSQIRRGLAAARSNRNPRQARQTHLRNARRQMLLPGVKSRMGAGLVKGPPNVLRRRPR